MNQAEYLNTQDLIEIFGVSRQTIHNWRITRDLPTLIFPNRKSQTVRFDKKAVIKWALKNGIDFIED